MGFQIGDKLMCCKQYDSWQLGDTVEAMRELQSGTFSVVVLSRQSGGGDAVGDVMSINVADGHWSVADDSSIREALERQIAASEAMVASARDELHILETYETREEQDAARLLRTAGIMHPTAEQVRAASSNLKLKKVKFVAR